MTFPEVRVSSGTLLPSTPPMDQLSENLARKINLKQGEDDLIAADPSHAAPKSDDHSLSLVRGVVIDRDLSINSSAP